MAKSFHELSPRAQMIVFGLLCVLALAGAWQVTIGPSSAELETRRAHLAKLEGEIVRVQAITDETTGVMLPLAVSLADQERELERRARNSRGLTADAPHVARVVFEDAGDRFEEFFFLNGITEEGFERLPAPLEPHLHRRSRRARRRAGRGSRPARRCGRDG